MSLELKFDYVIDAKVQSYSGHRRNPLITNHPVDPVFRRHDATLPVESLTTGRIWMIPRRNQEVWEQPLHFV
jgi:hypothetical protein